jgi:quinol monooxygenase YgiN
MSVRRLTTVTLYYIESKEITMVHASIRMQISFQKRDEVLSILRNLSRKTRYEAGCVSCRVYRGAEEEDGILLDQIWSDEQLLERHLRSANFNKVIQLAELSSAPPEFKFETILHSSGIETIVKARTPPGTGHTLTTPATREKY